jgi:hypothetical protein
MQPVAPDSGRRDRRGSARTALEAETLSWPVAGREAPRPCRLHDVSAGGVALVSDGPFPVGCLLAVELRDRGGGSRRPTLARVLHVRRTRDGRWFHGCAFTQPLAEDELQDLLS